LLSDFHLSLFLCLRSLLLILLLGLFFMYLTFTLFEHGQFLFLLFDFYLLSTNRCCFLNFSWFLETEDMLVA